MWARFSFEAKEVVFRAQEEATKRGHSLVSSLHLLAAIMSHPSANMVRVLEDLGVTRDRVLGDAEYRLGTPRQWSQPGDPRFTTDGRTALGWVEAEADMLGDAWVTPEHIFLGLLRDPGRPAGKLLGHLGVEYEAARKAVEAAPRYDETVRAFRPAPPGDAGETSE